MSWLDLLKYAVYGLGAMIALLWLLNLYRVLRKKSDCVPARRLMFILAILAIILSIARSSQLYGQTVVFADIVVLLCIVVAFVRSEKNRVQNQETD